MSLGQKIKAARRKAQLTQTQLAQKMGLREHSEGAISKWETDERIPSVGTIAKIAKALTIPVGQFLPRLNEVQEAVQHEYRPRGPVGRPRGKAKTQ